MHKKSYLMIIHDSVGLPRPCAHDDLRYLIQWDGRLSSLDAIIDSYQESFAHFFNWVIEIIPV